MLEAQLLEIGHGAGRPEALDLRLAMRALGDVGQIGEIFEQRQVDRFRRGAQHHMRRATFECRYQDREGIHRELGFAPEDVLDRIETMRLDPLDFLRGESGRRFRRADVAECPVLLVTPGATGDLGHFADRQSSRTLAVELAERREGDMIDIQVETHADGVGRHEIIDLTRLEHRDLGIARGRAERAHDDRAAATQTPQHLGDAIDLLDREGDDGGAPGEARELARPGANSTSKSVGAR